MLFDGGGGGCLVQSRAGNDITAASPTSPRRPVSSYRAAPWWTGSWWCGRSNRGVWTSALQRRIVSPTRAAALAAEEPATFLAFDLLAASGEDLPRKAALRTPGAARGPGRRLGAPAAVDATDHGPGHGAAVDGRDAAAPVGVEGVVMKPLGDPYKPRKRGWFKVRSLRVRVSGLARRLTDCEVQHGLSFS
jgi:hypothetical protein